MKRGKSGSDTDALIEISDDLFEAIMKEMNTNKANFERGKLKYMQWLEQDDYILEKNHTTKRDWLFAIKKRAGVHIPTEKKVDRK